MRALAAVSVVLLLLLGGCAGSRTQTAPGSAPDATPGRTYEVPPATPVSFRMDDGVLLDGAAWDPDPQHRGPVILHLLPYANMCPLHPDAPYPKPCAPGVGDDFWLDEYNGLPRELVRSGYTYVSVSVRGTGASGGCFSYLGERERKDVGLVLDQLAAGPWAGEVGMLGLSYMSITPLHAVLERPGRVKAVILGGIGVDEYAFAYTPQGASSLRSQVFWAGWLASVAAPPAASLRSMLAYPERSCPSLASLAVTYPLAHASDERPADHFLERRWLDRLAGQQTAVLVVQGLRDVTGGQQVEELWQALEGTPRAFVLGQWEHRFPDDALLEGSGLRWHALASSWLDHYLREAPAPAVLGRVHAQVEGAGWTTFDAWPPLGGEVLHIGGGLTRHPTPASLAFRSHPLAEACDARPGAWAAALSDPLPAATRLTGNPMAWLELRSSAPSATVAVDLWDVPGDDVCQGRLISLGAADLRFRGDPFQGADVPVGVPFGLRVDLHATAWEVPAGYRVGITFSSGGAYAAMGRPAEALIEVLPGSHVVLPMDAGVGEDVARQYPGRPLGVQWQRPGEP
ncbi:MAG TPA: CocE/NonD family hydrolase [Candidatus Thermoplasmatota archaeon]|nr:CocE/NonD family hydrolase [Candidatus Thermoplasmatota archaeon]